MGSWRGTYTPACADPRFFSGSEGVYRPNGQKTVWIFFKSSTYFTVYRGHPMVLLQRNLYFRSIQRGSIIFQWGSNFFHGGGGGGGGGVRMLISIETHITCDFPGGGGLDPLSPIWIRTCFWVSLTCSVYINMYNNTDASVVYRCSFIIMPRLSEHERSGAIGMILAHFESNLSSYVLT